MTKRIYIVEDDDSIRQLMKMALSSFSYEVTTFTNAEEAIEAIQQNIPDMVIFDIMLPGMSGIDATRKLRNQSITRSLPIVMLTAKNTENDKVTGLDAGADDYIAKPFGIMELGARIRSIFRRIDKNYTDNSDSFAISDLFVDNRTREVRRDGKVVDLTYKEYELLGLLVRERGRIVPRDELLNTVWGFDFVGETRTLDTHVRTLRQKLGDDADSPRYIKTVRNVGYRFIAGDHK